MDGYSAGIRGFCTACCAPVREGVRFCSRRGTELGARSDAGSSAAGGASADGRREDQPAAPRHDASQMPPPRRRGHLALAIVVLAGAVAVLGLLVAAGRVCLPRAAPEPAQEAAEEPVAAAKPAQEDGEEPVAAASEAAQKAAEEPEADSLADPHTVYEAVLGEIRDLVQSSGGGDVEYAFADVYGDAGDEMVCEFHADGGSGMQCRIYTCLKGEAVLMFETGVGRARHDVHRFYRDSGGLVIHGYDRGAEDEGYYRLEGTSYVPVAGRNRFDETEYPANEPWSYYEAGGEAIDEAQFNELAATIELGAVAEVSVNVDGTGEVVESEVEPESEPVTLSAANVIDDATFVVCGMRLIIPEYWCGKVDLVADESDVRMNVRGSDVQVMWAAYKDSCPLWDWDSLV